MVFCTEFVDGWWSWEPLRGSCVRCGHHPHAYAPETCRAKNTSIKLPCCIKLAFNIISWARCAVKQPSNLFVAYIYCVSPTCFWVQHTIIRGTVSPLLRVQRTEYFKTTDAQQAWLINNYKNAKYKLLKLLKTNAEERFDTICRKWSNN